MASASRDQGYSSKSSSIDTPSPGSDLRPLEPDYEFVPVSSEYQSRADELFNQADAVPSKSVVKTSPGGVVVTKYFKDMYKFVRGFEVRPDDVWIVTYPRTGTTWTQEAAWQIVNGVNTEESRAGSVYKRSPFFEFESLTNVNGKFDLEAGNPNPFTATLAYTARLQRPRVIKTHLPFFMLPEDIDKARIVYVHRDPRDVCVSYFHHALNMSQVFGMDPGVPFHKFAAWFREGNVLYGSYAEHLKNFKAFQTELLRKEGNVHAIWYDDIAESPEQTIKDLARFLLHGKELSQEKVDVLKEHLTIDNMRQTAIGLSGDNIVLKERSRKFYRDGKVGAGRKWFNSDASHPELAAESKAFTDWIAMVKTEDGIDMEKHINRQKE